MELHSIHPPLNALPNFSFEDNNLVSIQRCLGRWIAQFLHAVIAYFQDFGSLTLAPEDGKRRDIKADNCTMNQNGSCMHQDFDCE